MDPQDLAVIGEQVRPRRRRLWPFVVAVGMVLVLSALAWFTFIGYDTTVHSHMVGGPMPEENAACTWAIVVGGRMFHYVHPGPRGSIEEDSVPSGTTAVVHHELFHSTTYRFVANGQRIKLQPGGYVCGVH